MKKAIKISKNIMYYLFIGFLLLIIIVSAFSSGGLIKTLGFGWYRVISGSMEPVIMTNDYIVATKIDEVSDLNIGDIIIFEAKLYPTSKEKSIITHHYGGKSLDGNILTYPHKEHGKEHIRYDSWVVKDEDVLGIHKITLHVSGFVGIIIFLFSTPVGIILLISSVGAVYFLVKTIKEKKKNLIEVKEDKNELE